MKHYIVVKGGLGNQMFQYAFFKALKHRGLDVALDVTMYKMLKMHNGFELPAIFGVCESCISRHWFLQRLIDTINRLFKGAITTYDNRNPETNFNTSKTFLSGYWQSEAYFGEIKEDIIQSFRFQNIDDRNQDLVSEFNRCNSVSIHIRRGDYVGLSMYANVCTDEYYRSAISYIQKHVELPFFYIFSNDIEWSKTFAESLGLNYKIITHNSGNNSFKDMFLMTQCRHNILANSSFSWWGAYLNQNKGAIKIAPTGWDNTDTIEFNRIRVPASYIRL